MKQIIATAAAAVCALSAASVFAQYPERPITYVIPFVPAGESDIAARLQGKVATKITGKEFVVQNKPGAGGAVAWSQLNTLPADGYTVMGTNLPHILLQPLEAQPTYKTEDIVNVFFFHFTPDALVVAADSPYKTFADFAAAAKANPGKLNVAGSATNSPAHMATARLDIQGGMKVTYIPLKGTGEIVTQLLGRHVDAAMTFTTLALANKEKTRVLAVGTPNRLAQFPNAPTFKELGYDWVDGAYRGIAVPKSTPEAVRKQVSDLFAKINKDPEHRKQMTDAGFEQIDITYDQIPEFLKKRAENSLPLARKLGMIK